MPAKKKKEQKPLELASKSPAFYRAYMVLPDAEFVPQVDVSGDTFSNSPENAIRALIGRSTTEELTSLTVPIFLVGEDELEVKKERNVTTIAIMRFIAHNIEEFKDATCIYEPISDIEFMLKLKLLTDGYSLGIQDYECEEMTIQFNAPVATEAHLKSAHLVVVDEDKANLAFPHDIYIQG